MKNKETVKYAGIVTSLTVTRVTHLCLCDDSRPSIDGMSDGNGLIRWPVINDRFQMSYCPWCGLKLPFRIKEGL